MTSRATLGALLIALVGIGCFANSVDIPLLLDDLETISDNPQIRRLGLETLAPERELPVAGRSLANLTFALNYAVSGDAVRPYHVTNLALHLLCAVLAYLLIEQLLRRGAAGRILREHSWSVALAAVLVWTVHPLNSEVVNYVTQRTESLMAACYLLTLYCASRALDQPSRLWSVAAVSACVIGALCKETIATAPLVLMALDRLLFFPSWRDAWARRRGLYLGLCSSWVVLALLQSTQPRPYSTGFSTGVTVWTYLLNQAEMLARYLRLAVWPRDLVVFYGLPRALSLGDVVLPALFICALLVATAVAIRRRPALAACGIWFFFILAPTSSVLPIATEVGAERRMYLPLLALTLLAACTLWKVAGHWRVGGSVTALLVLLLGATTIARNREYADPRQLAELNLQRWPTGMSRLLVAEEYLKAGRRDEALSLLRAASVDAPRAHFTLGTELYNRGQLEEAATELQAFARLEPVHRAVPTAFALAARALARLQRWDEATEAANQALTRSPNSADARLVLAEADFQRSRFPAAVDHYRTYLAARPQDAEATTNLAVALMATGQLTEGVATFRRAADLDQRNWQTRRNLAVALLDANRPAEAVAEAQRAIELRPEDALSHTLLGQALAAIGERDAAVAALGRALQLDPDDADARALMVRLR